MDRAQGTPSSGVHRPGQRQHAHPAREPQQAGEDGGAARRRALGTRDALPRSQAQQHPGSCRGDAPHHLCSFSLQTCHHGKGHMLVSEHRRVSATGAQRRRGGGSPVLLPEAGRAVRRRSKSENSSASVSKPPATVRGSRWHSASPGDWAPQGSAPPRPPPVPAVPLVLGLAGDPPQGSEKAGAGAQGSEARGPLTGAPPGAGRRHVKCWHSPPPLLRPASLQPRAWPLPPSPHSPIPETTSSPTATSPPPPGLHTGGRDSHHRSPPTGRVLVLLQPQGPGFPPKGQLGALQGQQASRGPQRPG